MAIKNTGWIEPHRESACTKYKNETLSSWKRRDKALTQESNKEPDYDLSAVSYMGKGKKSGLFYMYDYKFNVPENATIKKIEVRPRVCGTKCKYRGVYLNLLKLKMGASVSDTGVGNNKADNLQLVTHEYAHYHGMQEPVFGNTDKSIKDYWGLDITPAMVNSADFGTILQFKGTLNVRCSEEFNKNKVYVDVVKIRITYDDNFVPAVKQNYDCILTSVREDPYNKDSKGKYNVLESMETKKKSDNPTPYKFWLRTTRKTVKVGDKKYVLGGNRAETIMFSEDGKLEFSRGINHKIIPGDPIESTTDEKVIKNGFDWLYDGMTVYINPEVEKELTDKKEIKATVKLFKYKKDKIYQNQYLNGECISTLTLTIERSFENIAYSQTIIRGCKFINNKSNKGSAIYNTGRLSIVDSEIKNNKTYGTNNDDCQYWDINLCRGFEFK